MKGVLRVRRIRVAIAGLLLGASTAVVAVQAPAAASYSDCPAGTGCVFTRAFGDGTMSVIPYSGFGDGGCHFIRAPFTNNVQSAKSDYGSGHWLRFWQTSNCVGTPYDVPAKSKTTFGPGNVGL